MIHFKKSTLSSTYCVLLICRLTTWNVLSKIAAAKKEQGTSFVIVSETIEVDALEDEMLSVVPTLLEAQDILDMDAMERDLGL